MAEGNGASGLRGGGEITGQSSSNVLTNGSGQQGNTGTVELNSMLSGIMNELKTLKEEMKVMKSQGVRPSQAQASQPNKVSGVGAVHHEMSESSIESGEDLGTEEDVVDPLTSFVASMSQPVSDLPVDNDLVDADLDKVMRELKSVFKGDEEKAGPLDPQLADIFKEGLRSRPVWSSLKTIMSSLEDPEYIPTLTVPITRTLSPSGKLLDGNLFRNSCVLAKAMVPLMNMMHDIVAKKDQNIKSYTHDINNSLTLLMAAFNLI